MNAALDNARSLEVPLYIGEFTNFSLGGDARTLTDADMAQTAVSRVGEQNRVNWTFWAYVNPWRPMTIMDYTTNRPITVVKNALGDRTRRPEPTAAQPDPVASFTWSQHDGPHGDLQRSRVFGSRRDGDQLVVELRRRRERRGRHAQRIPTPRRAPTPSSSR